MSRAIFQDRICAVLAAPTAAEMLRQFRAALPQTRTVELRLDWLRSEGEMTRLLGQLLRQRPHATFIATLRRHGAGGEFRGGLSKQFASLQLAHLCGCEWIDIERETAECFPSNALAQLLGPARRLVSLHDFRGTPRDLRKRVTRLARYGEAVKVATQCNSYSDVVRLLQLCRGRRNVVVVPMGEIGLPGRVLALREGSALAFAAVGQKTAPGQLNLDEMKSHFRADALNKRTRVYGVIGNPVAHSLSPLMHNHAFQERRMNAVYVPFLVTDLPDFLAAVKPLRISGFSVTLPHKQGILRHLHDCDPLAAAIGAVNTVVVRGNEKLYGANTDYVGVLRALERRVRLQGSRVLIVGAGGVARAVAFALAQAGAVVCVNSRRMGQAESLARAVNGDAVERQRIRREFFDAIVNATPVGMHPRAGESPLSASELNCRLVFDTIYRPLKTRLLHLAERRGIECVSGVEMFIAQGTAQWEIWTGQRAPVALMRRAVMEELAREPG